MATLKDIAKQCDVSVSTVSRILKRDKTLNVNAKTKELVWETAEGLGYKAKSKSTHGTRVAIVNWYSHDQEVIDPYYYYIRKGVESQSQLEGFEYDVFFKESKLDNLFEYDAIIAIGKFNKQQAKNLCLKVDGNIVFIDSNPDHLKYDSVQVDFDKMVEEMFKYVCCTPDQKIGLINGSEYLDGEKFIDPRTTSFDKQCKLNEVKNKVFIEGEFTIESGYQMFFELEQAGQVPDVLICGNDLIAMGANKAAYKLGLNVGTDVKIIGINNIPVAKYMVPSLTTVDIPQFQMGCEAVGLVKRKIVSKTENPITILVPTKLVRRKSC